VGYSFGKWTLFLLRERKKEKKEKKKTRHDGWKTKTVNGMFSTL
jgi:hypothetical protein